MAPRKYEPLTTEQIEALRSFAKYEGQKWKEVLSTTYWMKARLWRDPYHFNSDVGTILHRLRNTHGPSWLAGFTFPME